MTIESITHAVSWLFETLIAIGTIQHRTMIFFDVLLVVGGMLLRPTGRAGGRVYSAIKMKAQELGAK